MSEYRLIHGDCLIEMDKLTSEGVKVDAIITDPPWNMDYFKDDNKTWNDYCEWLSMVLHFFERFTNNIVCFQSSKAIPFVAHIFKEYETIAVGKNFSQMTKKKLPNCYDIVFLKYDNGTYLANGRNWFLSNTAGMLKQRVGHPTQRALDVMEFIVHMFNFKTILDPFMGSGTTGVACKNLNRGFIGIELDDKYFQIAKTRIENHIVQGELIA